MASIYLAKTSGTGRSNTDSIKPNGFDGIAYSTLMIQQDRSPNCIVLSPTDTVVATGVDRLFSFPTMRELKEHLKLTVVTAAERTLIDRWATQGDLLATTPMQQTWWECLEYLVRQVNPTDLDAVFDSYN